MATLPELQSIAELEVLLQKAEYPAITLSMPMVVSGPDVQQNPIRFRNLLRQAEQELHQNHAWHATIKDTFEEIQATVKEVEFWTHRQAGLVAFITPTFWKVYHIPFPCPEQVTVGEQFQVKPLLQVFAENGRFLLLKLSQKHTALFEVNQYSISQIEVPGMPESIEAVWGDSEIQQSQRSHIQGTGGRGIFHGQSSEDETDKMEIEQFFREVDKALRRFLAQETAPLVLSGVEYYIPLYRSVSTYQHIYEDFVKGNVDSLGLDELQVKAWEVIEPHFHAQLKHAQDRYRELQGREPGRAVEDIKEVVKNAAQGRIEILFATPQAGSWGTYEPSSSTVTVHASPQQGDYDLIEFATTNTLFNKGKVYIVPAEEVPYHQDVAAILRY